MFGAVTAYLYDYLLGIRAKDGCAGYSEIVIAPVLVDNVNCLEGHRTLKSGKVTVAYKKNGNSVEFDIEIPENQPAEFIYGGKAYKLNAGKNHFEI